jgi:hypothetical protein
VQAPPGTHWDLFRAYMQNPARRAAVAGLRAQVETLRGRALDPRVPDLRMVDTAIWMRNSRAQGAGSQEAPRLK